MSSKNHKVNSSNHSYLLIITFVIIFFAAIFFGYGIFANNYNEESKFDTTIISVGDIEKIITATGTVDLLEFVDVGAQVSGQLKTIYVEVGSVVEKGDLMAEIDATVLMARVDSTRAQLLYQKAQLEDRKSQYTQALYNHDRQKNLYYEEATTKELFQESQTKLVSAKAQVSMIEAQIKQTISSLVAEEANLNFTNIYAPISGTVVSLSARAGQTLNASQQAPIILRIADLSAMQVVTQVSEADIVKLVPNMDVYFTTLGSEGKRWNGKLKKIEPMPSVTDSVVLYNAIFDVPNDGILMPKMTAQVFFVDAAVYGVNILPVSSISLVSSSRQSNEGVRTKLKRPESEKVSLDTNSSIASGKGRAAKVFVLKDNGSIEEREIIVGVMNRIHAQVISGVNNGERVILQQNIASDARARRRSS